MTKKTPGIQKLSPTRWVAQYTKNGRHHYVGTFASEQDAERAIVAHRNGDPSVAAKLRILKSKESHALSHRHLPNMPVGISRGQLIDGTAYFVADTSINGVTHRVGTYKTEHDAVEGRDKWIKENGAIDAEEQRQRNLRERYDAKRVDGVAMQFFKGKKPRSDSTTGYRGVVKKKGRYYAWITVSGERHYSGMFDTPAEAYYNGRLKLEAEFLRGRY